MLWNINYYIIEYEHVRFPYKEYFLCYIIAKLYFKKYFKKIKIIKTFVNSKILSKWYLVKIIEA